MSSGDICPVCKAPPWAQARTKVVHSGQFRVRLPNDLHDVLTVEAERQSVSLNTLIIALLAGGIGWKPVQQERILFQGDETTATVVNASGGYVRFTVPHLQDEITWTDAQWDRGRIGQIATAG